MAQHNPNQLVCLGTFENTWTWCNASRKSKGAWWNLRAQRCDVESSMFCKGLVWTHAWARHAPTWSDMIRPWSDHGPTGHPKQNWMWVGQHKQNKNPLAHETGDVSGHGRTMVGPCWTLWDHGGFKACPSQVKVHHVSKTIYVDQSNARVKVFDKILSISKQMLWTVNNHRDNMVERYLTCVHIHFHNHRVKKEQHITCVNHSQS